MSSKIDYDQISKIYDDVRAADVALLNCFGTEIAFTPAARVLDIGCGTGNHTDVLQRLTGAQVYGVEPSEGMIEKARAKNPAITFKPGDGAHIPFEDRFFDFVYMTDVIHHVPDIAAMFGEIYRVLRSGGKVCIVTQSHAQIERRVIVPYFPGTAAADKARYPDIDRIVQVAGEHKLRSLKNEVLYEGSDVLLDDQYLELVRKKGYSMLHLISDEEYAVGLRKLEAQLCSGPVTATSPGETLVWLVKA